MPTQRKIFTVQNLAEKFKQAKALILTDYSGLKVSQINELRNEIKKTGAEFEVVKNSLFCRAAENSPFALLRNSPLKKPTAVLWLYAEDYSPLKVLDNFIKKNELPKLKTGFWNGQEISLERIRELARLPGLTDLQAKLIGLLQSPLYRLARGLSWNLQKLVFILQSKGGETNG